MNVLFHQHHVDVASADRDHVAHAVHQHGVDDALRAEEGIAVCKSEHECVADLELRYFECVDVNVRETEKERCQYNGGSSGLFAVGL